MRTQAIGKQVFFRERSELMDKDSLEDAETSLQNMLHDFVYDDKNNIPEDLRCDGEGGADERACVVLLLLASTARALTG